MNDEMSNPPVADNNDGPAQPVPRSTVVDLAAVRRDPTAWTADLVEQVTDRWPDGPTTVSQWLADVEDIVDGLMVLTTANDHMDGFCESQGDLAAVVRQRLDGLRVALGIDHEGDTP
jgi:hypothetical protein